MSAKKFWATPLPSAEEVLAQIYRNTSDMRDYDQMLFWDAGNSTEFPALRYFIDHDMVDISSTYRILDDLFSPALRTGLPDNLRTVVYIVEKSQAYCFAKYAVTEADTALGEQMLIQHPQEFTLFLSPVLRGFFLCVLARNQQLRERFWTEHADKLYASKGEDHVPLLDKYTMDSIYATQDRQFIELCKQALVKGGLCAKGLCGVWKPQ